MRRGRSPQLVAFGRFLRRARWDREMSQEELGGAAGVGAKHLSEIERANRDPRLTTLLKIARALDLQGDELLDLYAKLLSASEG